MTTELSFEGAKNHAVEGGGNEGVHQMSESTSTTARRNPVPESAMYYKHKAKGWAGVSDYLQAYYSLNEAFNHLENAAYAEAQRLDELKAKLRGLLAEWDVDDQGVRRSFCVQDVKRLLEEFK